MTSLVFMGGISLTQVTNYLSTATIPTGTTTFAGIVDVGDYIIVNTGEHAIFSQGFRGSSTALIGWSATGSGTTAYDTVFQRDSAAVIAARNSTTAHALRVYDTYTSATDYHRVGIATARATLASVSGATVTATTIIPDGAIVVGVTTKVTVALGTGNGTTGYLVGDGSDNDRWGAVVGTTVGTSSDNTNWTATTVQAFTSASDVVITASTGNFDGTGTIAVSVQYIRGECD